MARPKGGGVHEMAEEESVKVAVRMRLFNNREKTAGASRVVRMTQEEQGSKTYIVNPDTGKENCFAFDYSFQSHSETEQGIGEYATQDTVFNELGKPVLYNALEGRNVCLFAYGQTGAGKSFSMLGKASPPEQQGIIPRSCLEIFRLRDQEKDDPCVSYKISIQVVEVYCEMINDLLEVRSKWPPNGHKPRLTKDGYVVDTVTRPCSSYPDIEQAFTIADKNRSVGSHALNPESSRAHTIYTINYMRQKKTSPDAKQAETISSKINLVDLAGSERSESAGTTGQMLKEGNAINLSLTALGSTIKALSEGNRPNFRDSKLTLLLQGSMTNGKVIMIAAVSPASICYDESMSTLRFAERIKMVKIKAKKNVTQDPVAEIKKEMEEMRRAMQEEIDNLKAQAEGKALPESEEAKALKKLLDEQVEYEKQMKEDFARQLAQYESNQDQAETEKQARAAMDAEWENELGVGFMKKVENIEEPHLRNLNEDPRLAETLFYPFKKGVTKIGRSNKSDPPDIEFNGMGIIKDHATVNWDPDTKKVVLTNSANAATTVNGKKVTGDVPLLHNSRIWLGNNYAFRFVYPGCEAEGEQLDEDPDYLFAEAEIANQVTGLPTALGHQLSEALKKVEQANIITSDLRKPITFQPRIIKNRVDHEDNVVVQAQFPQGTLVWPWEKFNLRLMEMVKIWQLWQAAEDKEEEFVEPVSEDPPFEDNEPQLIGEADVWLQSLGNMIEHEADAALLAPIGEPEGRIQLEIKPLDKNGGEGPWEGDNEDLDPFVDSPEELLNKEIQFIVRVKKVIFDVDLKEGGNCKYERVWVRYKLDITDPTEEWNRTEECAESTFTPSFDWCKTHTQFADKDFLDLLTTRRIVFQVWGRLKLQSQQKPASNAPSRPKSAARGANDPKKRLLDDLSSSIDLMKKGLPALPEGWTMVPGYRLPNGELTLDRP
eukprot:TRINITY_DN8827_c0_g1_i1.p1 TRINITY_DN8827_c0_g1~~TRINITY_DN8827_c0_g1_i1.p1  ORF type:complete len:942 (+),score=190.00 TRINITY_DN8827_c0_g1_i1:150-2975(+)